MTYRISEWCVCCERCVIECPAGAISFDGSIEVVDPVKCTSCGVCAEICNTGAAYDADNPPPPPQKHDLIELDCDLVVLGGGGGGMVAAARTATITGKKVIVLEKTQHIGGGAWFAADFKVFNSKWQLDAGIPDVCDKSILAAMDATYWKLDPHLVRNCFRATGQFFDWLCSLGEDVAGNFTQGTYIFDGPGGPCIPVFKRQRRGRQGGTGQFVMERMLEQCQKCNVEILTEHSAVDLVVENGKIAAVIADDPGGQTRINCKACVLATGSWINNQEILERCAPKFAKLPMSRSPHRHIAYTGDGIALAEKAGAFVDYASFCLRLMGPMAMVPSDTVMSIINDPAVIYVNRNGKRWINELTLRRIGIFDTAVPLLEQPEGTSFTVFDESILTTAVEKFKAGVSDDRGFFGQPSYPADYQVDLANVLQQHPGKLFRSSTLDGLAEQIGVDPEAFGETVRHYNEMCANGRDDDFFKQPEQMISLSKPPYYAVRAIMGTDGAFGGVLVNEDMQAYGKNGGLVEGLYVVGDFSSGRFINMGGVKKQIINDLAWAFASGYIAAERVSKYLYK